MVHAEALGLARRKRSDMIVDDGGDATMLINKGVEYEAAGKVPAFNPETEPEEWGVILDLLRDEVAKYPGKYTRWPRRFAA